MTQEASHRCLRVDEIYLRICRFITADTTAGSRTLAALLRVCKAFYEPALDLLWYEQASLDGLVRCLPQHLWRIDHEYGIVRYLLSIPVLPMVTSR